MLCAELYSITRKEFFVQQRTITNRHAYDYYAFISDIERCRVFACGDVTISF